MYVGLFIFRSSWATLYL